MGTRDIVIAKSESGHPARSPGFEQDLYALEKQGEAVSTRRGREVHDEAALAGVEGEMEAATFERGFVIAKGAERTETFPARGLEFEDGRAEVGKQSAGVAAGHTFGTVDDREVLKGAY